MTERLPPALRVARTDKADIYAIKALSTGTASDAQQKRALTWILEQASRYDELSYEPGEIGRRDTDFAEGRRFVGLQIAKLIRMPPEVAERKTNG
ncbi:MAG TPA: hypothetical protein PKI99_04165 [Terrimesophilobacter sp.]|nr:hypothetical protein [Terrimesophilobacter sp.]